MEEKMERLKGWMDGRKNPPTTIELNITNRCNQRCLSCWQRSGNVGHDELPDEKWLGLVNEAGRLGVKELRLPGSGEPLARKELVLRIIEEAVKHGMNGLLITNGMLFDKAAVMVIVKSGWGNVTFSLDGPDATTHDYLRGTPGAFDAATKWIREFASVKKDIGAQSPLLRINTVLSNKNYDKLDKIMELAHDLGCGAVSLQPMTGFSAEGEKLRLSDEQIAQLPESIEKAKRTAARHGIFTNIESFITTEVVGKSNEMDSVIASRAGDAGPGSAVPPCLEPWYNIVITPDGIAGPCSMFGGAGGAILGSKSLSEVWYGETFEGIRRRLRAGKLFDFCKNCCVVVFEENARIRRELANG
jgi:MoaA/NifB/PqqE/SkfB family radical SAM enzyme